MFLGGGDLQNVRIQAFPIRPNDDRARAVDADHVHGNSSPKGMPSTFKFEIGLGEFGGGTRVKAQSALDFWMPPNWIGSHVRALVHAEWEQQQ